MSLKIKEEVKKQFDAGFLAIARYPEWVANIVHVPKKDGKVRMQRAIYYLSKKFTACEMNYLLLERTCCALACAAHCLRQYMLSYTTWLVSKMDPIKYIFEKPVLIGRIAWWQVLLSEFDIVYVTQKAIKGSALADYLAQQTINDYQPMHPEFPNEDIMALFEEEVEDKDRDKWVVWFDGVSNALGHGIRVVLVSPDKQSIDFRLKLLKVYGDSALVIYQLKGEWVTRDHKLVPYQAYIRELMELFDEISFHHIPREENQMADALATLSSMFKVNPHGDLPCIDIRCHVKQKKRKMVSLGTSISNDTLRARNTYLRPLTMTKGNYGGWQQVSS
eukprot:XP_014629655.1 uncharacterized protein LOC106798196 [Glycine max]